MYVLSIVVYPVVLFLLAIALSVLLRYTVSDCNFWYLQTLIIRPVQLAKLEDNANFHTIVFPHQPSTSTSKF